MEYHLKAPDNSITIIDAIMGSGKSTYMIKEVINKNPQNRYLIVVTTIGEKDKNGKYVNGEVGRYLSEIQAEAYDPKSTPRKLDSLKYLISHGKNIVTTHALIQRIDREAMDLLSKCGYTLIIDECLEVVSSYPCTKSDVKLLYQYELVYPDEDGFLVWKYQSEENRPSVYQGKFSDIKNLCENHCLRCLPHKDGTYSEDVLIWTFPSDFFSLFEETFICTYLWNGSFQKSFFDLNHIQYDHRTLVNGVLIPYNPESEFERRRTYGELINLYEGPLNNVGRQDVSSRNPLSASWYNSPKNDHYLRCVQNNTYNYFHNITKTPSNQNMYTVYIKFKSRIAKNGYTKGFVPCTCKATNKYRNKSSLAYLINYFPPVDIVHFFEGNGVDVNQDLFALSEMLQWIWRSQIREGKPINLYIPSERMRALYNDWISGRI